VSLFGFSFHIFLFIYSFSDCVLPGKSFLIFTWNEFITTKCIAGRKYAY
jgi:hypothetical protein